MDAALKSQNMGSAAVRRQRMQERQIQKHLAYQQMLDRKRLVTANVQSVDDSDSDADAESDSSSNMGASSAAETPSEASVQTPATTSMPDAFVTLSSTVYDAAPESIRERIEIKLPETTSEGLPKMQATLTTMADWNYDRFSMLIEPSNIEGMLAAFGEEEDNALSSSDEELENCSPIEIATPISYTMPTTKPSVVSIVPIRSVLPLNISKRPTIRRHVSEQISSTQVHGTSDARELRLFHASNSSRETLSSTNGSSQVSRSVSLASQNDSIVSRSVSQTSQSDQSSRSPKRKSSMPLLFGNNKNGYSRMSSIKKFIRSSTLGPPMSNHSHNNSVQRSVSGATLETHFEDRGASMEIMRQKSTAQEVKRPMTARAPSPIFPTEDSVIALPNSPPFPIQTGSGVQQWASLNEGPKARPTARFRSRSGSIGQALKSVGSGPRRTDDPAPPLPAIFIPPPPSQSVVLDADFPVPPLLTPRNPKRTTASYSPFPSTEKRSPTFADKTATTPAVSVGLGLHY